MRQINQINPVAHYWLYNQCRSYWCKYPFNSNVKYDVLINSLTKSSNNTLLAIRGKLIISMAECKKQV